MGEGHHLTDVLNARRLVDCDIDAMPQWAIQRGELEIVSPQEVAYFAAASIGKPWRREVDDGIELNAGDTHACRRGECWPQGEPGRFTDDAELHRLSPT